ncbi:MAG: hypothetical protein IPJ30_27735 [Acidobacteria bacterium]|nr:hypothetical protein [Acidobacteriota bacterium]
MNLGIRNVGLGIRNLWNPESLESGISGIWNLWNPESLESGISGIWNLWNLESGMLVLNTES